MQESIERFKENALYEEYMYDIKKEEEEEEKTE